MEQKKELLVKYIKDKLTTLEELGKEYSEEKINLLADKLLTSNKSFEELRVMIDNKFSNQVRKINHNNHLLSLKNYYLSSIDKLKKNNNCYLLSYDRGIKILEQALVTETKKVNNFLTQVTINENIVGYKKENSINNDYELIMSDLAYLFKIDYAKTYRMFDAKMEPIGVLNEAFTSKNERFLNLEEAFKFIKEESTKFTLKTGLEEFHNQSIKKGLTETKDKTRIKDNIEYVFKLFRSLPDITKENIDELRRDYLNMKIFELITNSLNNNLSNIGLIVNKEKVKYTYRLSPSYNKYTIEIPTIKDTQTICNFNIVEKKDLLHVLSEFYYDDTKELLSLVSDNKDTLLPLMDQVIKEHLEYEEYNKYHNLVVQNIDMIVKEMTFHKNVSPDTEADKKLFKENNNEYAIRISPFVENYIVEDVDPDEKGSTILIAIVTIVLFITISIIVAAIYAVSKVDM